MHVVHTTELEQFVFRSFLLLRLCKCLPVKGILGFLLDSKQNEPVLCQYKLGFSASKDSFFDALFYEAWL